jgi:hypothetical protein
MSEVPYSTCICAIQAMSRQIYTHVRQLCSNEMIRVCKSCGKEFQSFNEGAIYSSSVMGILDFCSDECCRKYLNANISKQYHGEQKG